jgi:hypothetical protein
MAVEAGSPAVTQRRSAAGVRSSESEEHRPSWQGSILRLRHLLLLRADGRGAHLLVRDPLDRQRTSGRLHARLVARDARRPAHPIGVLHIHLTGQSHRHRRHRRRGAGGVLVACPKRSNSGRSWRVAAAVPFALPYVVIAFGLMQFSGVVAPQYPGHVRVARSRPLGDRVSRSSTGPSTAPWPPPESSASRRPPRLAGRRRTQALMRVVLPNISAGLVTGGLLSFAASFGEFAMAQIIGREPGYGAAVERRNDPFLYGHGRLLQPAGRRHAC